MLSTENSPPDPCELISQLKSSCRDNICTSDEDKGSDGEQCQLEVVDLLLDQSSGLDDKKNPPPNFSIRNYVFSKRQKDICTNWPFSEKTLQLCLKHKLKDVLPPFQSLDSMKNPSLVNPVDESISIFNSEHNYDRNLAVDTEKKINSSRSKKDKEYKSTTTSQSCDIQKPVKKCKLIVKLSNITEPKPKQDFSESTMASKVCPVCKTFSSSSNTTLNAHIDQCLSGESTAKWTANSKSMKHRIKPRKMRLMVDIYETALHGTLEDLDKRNGTNWASNSSFTAQDNEVCAEEKSRTCSSVNLGKNDNNNEESAVYVDSNGTKVRILSKLNDPPSSSTVKDDNGPRKLAKTDKASQLLCNNKKKYLINKHTISKSPSEVNFERREIPIEGHKKEDLKWPLRTYDQMTSNDLGMIKQWVSSKQTCLRKKMNLENKKQEKTMKVVRLKSNIVSLGKFMNRTNDANSSILSDENLRLRKRRHNLLCSSHDELKDQPFPRKTSGLFPRNVKPLSKVGPSVLERGTDPPNGTKNHVSSLNSMKTGTKIVYDHPCISLNKPHARLFSSRSKEFASTNNFSSLRKNLLPVNHVSIHKSKKKLCRKFSDFKKRSLHYALRSDEEAVEMRFAKQGNLVETPSKREIGFSESLMNRSRFSKIRKNRGKFTSKGQDEDIASEDSDSFKSDSYGDENSTDPGVGHDVTSSAIPDELVREPIRVADEEAFVKVHEERTHELLLSGEQEFFSKVGKYLVSRHNTDSVAEMDGHEGNGNYIVEVDTISIPGPPGSFLPSPGRMGLEELPIISSLTTCKIQSSENEHELVDMHSSDSPTSNFVAARSDSVSFMNMSHFVQNETQFGDADNRMDPFVESSPFLKQQGTAERKVKLDESTSDLTLHEKADLRFENEKPCCCSRKEGVLQSGPLNNQDSKLLRRFAPEPVSLNSEATFQARGNCESPSPLSPNPVLRLMGKNLMVVNKDENLQSCIDNGENLHNVPHSLHHTSSRAPPVFDTVQKRFPAQHFNLSPSHSFKVPTTSRTVQLGPHPSTAPQHSYGGFYGRENNDFIIIDHSPKNEPCLDKRLDVNVEHGGSSAHMALAYGSRHVDHPYSYPGHGYPLCSGFQIQDANSNEGKNGNLIEWIYGSESSSVVHPNPLTASSPSTMGGHLRSPLYFSPINRELS